MTYLCSPQQIPPLLLHHLLQLDNLQVSQPDLLPQLFNSLFLFRHGCVDFVLDIFQFNFVLLADVIHLEP